MRACDYMYVSCVSSIYIVHKCILVYCTFKIEEVAIFKTHTNSFIYRQFIDDQHLFQFTFFPISCVFVFDLSRPCIFFRAFSMLFLYTFLSLFRSFSIFLFYFYIFSTTFIRLSVPALLLNSVVLLRRNKIIRNIP